MTDRRQIGRAARLFAVCAGVMVTEGCTEELLTNFNAGNTPGAEQETIEITLKASDLPFWRDTTYTGFAEPSSVGYQLIVQDTALLANALGRFRNLPDSVTVDSTQLAINGFENGRIRLVFDSLLSRVPEDSSGVLVTVYSLSRTYEEREANWLEARTGEAWTTPGGDVGETIAQGQVISAADTLFMDLVVSTDSLLQSWRDNEGEPGVLVRIDSAGQALLRVQNFSVIADGTTDLADSTVSITRGAQATTFLQDPRTPAITTSLRMAGLPAARPYWKILLPDSIGGIPLRGSTINKAAFVFYPLPPPDYPFALQQSDTSAISVTVTATAVALLSNPFVDFEKTPVGGLLVSPAEIVSLIPDSLAAGVALRFDATLVLADWATDPDFDDERLQFGIRAAPQGGALGYWEFGSVESAPAQQPELKIVFTPPVDFVLP